MTGENKNNKRQENYPNLIVPTSGQAQKNGSMGGKASAAATKKRKKFKELVKMLLEIEVPEQIKEKLAESFPELDPEEFTGKFAIIASQYKKALQGDSKAFELLRDTAGEKPIEKNNLSGEIIEKKIFITKEDKEEADNHIMESIKND